MSHAKLSPSSAHRWAVCTASPALVERLKAEGKIPVEESSVFADEGTKAHAYAADALEAHDLGMDFDYSVIPDQIMASHVRAYVDVVTSRITGDGQLQIEQRVPLFYSKEEGGTADAIVLTDDCLHILDLKYGQGVSVESKENPQLVIYAESVIRQMKLRDRLPAQFDVCLTIFQPRAREGEPLREWHTSLGEIGYLATDLGAVARQIQNQGVVEGVRSTEFVAGEKQCRFCPAKALCKAYATWVMSPVNDTLIVDSELLEPDETMRVVTSIPPEEMSNEALEQIVAAKLEGRFSKWLEACEAYVLDAVMRGESFKGVKAVTGEKRRIWEDEGAALKLLRQKVAKDQLVTEKLVSPAQAWKLVPKDVSTKFKNKLESLITKPEGGPVLVLATDKREALQPVTAESAFGAPVVDPEDDIL